MPDTSNNAMDFAAICSRMPGTRGASEWIITQLRHDDVFVGLRRSADSRKREPLGVGVLRADLDRSEHPLMQRMVEATRKLPDLLGVAVALGRRRVLHVAAAIVVERIAETERQASGPERECGLRLLQSREAVDVEHRRRMPGESALNAEDRKDLERAVLAERRVAERGCA